MNRWLFKTDPDTYSWDDLFRVKQETWDGVRNPLALKHLRSVKKGDLIFVYHTGKDKLVVGIAEALGSGYPDPKSQDPKLAVVDIRAKEALRKPVSLAEIKASSSLKTWELVRFSRLSVMPASDAQWREVLKLADK